VRPGRKTAIAAGVAGGVLGVGAIGAWAIAPSMARDEAVARLERRTGLRCTIGDASVGLGSSSFGAIQLRDEGGALDIRLDQVELDAGLFGLAIWGSDAVDRIAIRGGTVAIVASGDPIGAAVSRLRGEDGRAEPGGGGSDRVLVVEAVDTTLRDEHGELLTATVGARLEDGAVTLSLDSVAIAPGTSEATTIEHVEAAGSLADRRVSTLSARAVTVEVGDAAEDEIGAVGRLRTVARRARGASPDPDGPVATEGARAAGPLRFLADAFSATVSDLTVRRRTTEVARDVLTDLDATFTRVGPDAIQTQGHGSPDGGGRLAWDLRIEPMALRAVGSVDLEQVAVAVVAPLLPSALPLHRPEDARLGAELRIVGEGDALHATGRLSLRDLALASPRIAPQPIRGIALAMDGEATFRPDQRRLEIARLRVETGAAHVDVNGAIEWAPDHYLFELEATLPPTRCNDAIGAIPPDLLQEVAGFDLNGQIGGRLATRIDSRDLDATTLTIRVADGCRFDHVPAIADLSRFEEPFTHRVEEPDGSIFEMVSGPGSDSWAPISEMSPFFVHAVLGHEDGAFFTHSGFSQWSIREAIVRNLRAGRYVMGASTISMQLVKNVFLRREKTLARKVQEVLLTWWIESAMSKERILELYLNVIEYGPSVYGIRNAAHHYFGVAPADLTPGQSAYLASILPNPPEYHSHWEARSIPTSFQNRVSRFLRRLGERGRYDEAAVNEGLAELPNMRFYRDSETPPVLATIQGSTAPLPIAGATPITAAWDESLDGEVAVPDDEDYE
jgi:hypothetical protein